MEQVITKRFIYYRKSVLRLLKHMFYVHLKKICGFPYSLDPGSVKMKSWTRKFTRTKIVQSSIQYVLSEIV